MKELEEMKKAFDNLTESALQLNEMYKEKSKRIDKAIDYLENHYLMFDKKELLDILRGENNE